MLHLPVPGAGHRVLGAPTAAAARCPSARTLVVRRTALPRSLACSCCVPHRQRTTRSADRRGGHQLPQSRRLGHVLSDGPLRTPADEAGQNGTTDHPFGCPGAPDGLPRPQVGALSTQAGELLRPADDGVEHRLGEPSRERVLLADVVAAQQHRARPERHLAPCANGGSGLGHAHAGGGQRGEQPPTTRSRRAPRPRARSAARGAARLPATASRCLRSAVVGLLTGGAHRTPRVRRVCRSSCPSPACVLVGCVASPARCSAAYSQSPLRSPVKMRPVRLPPCAAGASPTTRMRGRRAPQPDTGRPQ